MGGSFSCLAKCMPQAKAVTVHRSVRGVSLAEFTESLFYSLLPVVKLAIGGVLADLNKSKDGMDLGGVYRLKAVRQEGTGDLRYNEFIKDIIIKDLEFLDMKHKCDIKVLSGGDLDGDGEADEEGVDDDGKPDEFFTFRNSVIRMDVRTNLKVKLLSELLDFQLKGTKFYTPNLKVDVKDVHMKCKLRMWWNLLTSKLRIAFLEEPSISWDIDLKVSVFELPDAIEDGLVTWALQKMLAGFGPESPLEIQLEKFLQQMVRDNLAAKHSEGKCALLPARHARTPASALTRPGAANRPPRSLPRSVAAIAVSKAAQMFSNVSK